MCKEHGSRPASTSYQWAQLLVGDGDRAGALSNGQLWTKAYAHKPSGMKREVNAAGFMNKRRLIAPVRSKADRPQSTKLVDRRGQSARGGFQDRLRDFQTADFMAPCCPPAWWAANGGSRQKLPVGSVLGNDGIWVGSSHAYGVRKGTL